MDFKDFAVGNPKLKQLKELLSADSDKLNVQLNEQLPSLTIRRKSANDLNADFAWCHDQIHRKDALSYTAAFMEFVKLIFIKLLSDREVHEKNPEMAESGVFQVIEPARNVKFSVAAINAAEEAGIDNPIAVRFDELRESLELQIKQQNKKRIFSENEKLALSKDLTKDIVRRLESADLYGLDADINGRLFETFLNATLRGKSLGQYFTPRSVVKLAVAMSDLQVGIKHQGCDVVIDGCCGSGGFLIEALAAMWKKVESSPKLSQAAKNELKNDIATKCIYGIDSAKDPALARIARMNMYLHGDGGSAIYQLDALDKGLAEENNASPESRSELRDFKRVLKDNAEGFADVALTNPPFARDYERKKRGGGRAYAPSVLDAYELSYDGPAEILPKAKLKSSAMFLERYLDFLKPGGRLVSVIDDSVLGSKAFATTRAWLAQKYIVEAVVSLPGDAFQRSEARVKTSILIMRKKVADDEAQGEVFMCYSQFVGIDDPARERVLPVDEDNHKKAQEEIERISKLFARFSSGDRKKDMNKWVVKADALSDRWDVKACLLKPGKQVPKWKAAKVAVSPLSNLVTPVFVDGRPADTPELLKRVIRPRVDEPKRIVHLRMTYRGIAERGEEKFSADTEAAMLFQVSEGDIVISHINAVHGAIGIVPASLEGSVVTSEYTVLRPKDGMDARVICSILRNEDVRADILLTSTGIGRTRATWKELSGLIVPVPPAAKIRALVKIFDELELLSEKMDRANLLAHSTLKASCHLGSKDSSDILQAFKPPQ
ncbi:N-6 DNA methylase [Xanthomonas campestris]|uniref:N-6 DNA methylase n=2 Tax=Xanthomonas campestris TaxID=339 RepID=UPI002379C454|nr:N-6 DNA methylase [Xanthomonas campestris]